MFVSGKRLNIMYIYVNIPKYILKIHKNCKTFLTQYCTIFNKNQSKNGEYYIFLVDLICKTNFHPYMTCRGSYYFRISGVEITYS